MKNKTIICFYSCANFTKVKLCTTLGVIGKINFSYSRTKATLLKYFDLLTYLHVASLFVRENSARIFCGMCFCCIGKIDFSYTMKKRHSITYPASFYKIFKKNLHTDIDKPDISYDFIAYTPSDTFSNWTPDFRQTNGQKPGLPALQ